MLTPRGRLEWLRLLLAQPMTLCCYSSKGQGTSPADFVETGKTKPLAINAADWTVDERNVSAHMNKTFTFSGVGEKVSGWYLALRDKEGTILDWKELKEPFTVNSTRDKLHVVPTISLKGTEAR